MIFLTSRCHTNRGHPSLKSCENSRVKTWLPNGKENLLCRGPSISKLQSECASSKPCKRTRRMSRTSRRSRTMSPFACKCSAISDSEPQERSHLGVTPNRESSLDLSHPTSTLKLARSSDMGVQRLTQESLAPS